MKTLFLQRRPLPLVLASALLLAAPVSMLLPGCGGGNSLSSQTFTSTVPLSSAQNGLLTLNTNGSNATGTFVVSGLASGRQTQALSFSIPNGTYTLSGTFSSPSFNISGTIPGVGPFTIEGQVPNNGGNGNYTLTANGETVSGTFGSTTPTSAATATTAPTTSGTPQTTATTNPTTTTTATARPTTTATTSPTTTASSTPGPTNTPRPTATPTLTPRPTATATTRPTATPRPTATTRPTPIPTNNGCSNEDANLAFSAFSASYNGSRVNTTCGSGFSVSAAVIGGNPNGVSISLSLFEGINTTVKERRLALYIDSPTPITQGTQYQLSAPSPEKQVGYAEFRGSSNTALRWNYTKTGTVTVNAISDSSITLTLSNVSFNAQGGGAAGSFTLNGTFNVRRQ